MKYICFKNWHWFLPIIPKIYFYKKKWEWNVIFYNKYFIEDNDKYDYNKLCGISNAFNVRKNSLRIGWRYNQENNTIDLCSFKEINKKFQIKKITEVNLETKTNIIFNKISDEKVEIIINKISTIIEFKLNKINFNCFLYFGGQKTAPNKIIIKIN